MRKEFSIYLDLVRFVASFAVVLYHACDHTGEATRPAIGQYGHEAVIVFFVLSGYVITFVTDTRGGGAREYWISRLARIYSVAIPAILLTWLVDRLGMAMAPAVYEGKAPHDHALVRIGSSFFFLNEVWIVSIMLFSNAAYWSLCYEVWYYALFAAMVFSHGRRRALYISLICLLLGPKVLLLAPLWFLGAALHRWKYLQRLTPARGWLLILASSVGLWAFRHYGLTREFSAWLVGVIGPYWNKQLTFSMYFGADYLLGLLIFAHFAGVRAVCHQFTLIAKWFETPIRFLANGTFSLYLFHQGLLPFFTALLVRDRDSDSSYWMIVAAATCTAMALSFVTERRKDLARRIVTAIWDRGVGVVSHVRGSAA